MKHKQLAKDLDEILNRVIDHTLFPYVKGNSIRIKQYAVRKSKAGYLIYDCKSNAQVQKTFSKAAALALAKTKAQGYNYEKNIMDWDSVIEKYFNDALFYNHTMKVSKDDMKREIAETRYDIAKTKVLNYKTKLEKIIYS